MANFQHLITSLSRLNALKSESDISIVAATYLAIRNSYLGICKPCKARCTSCLQVADATVAAMLDACSSRQVTTRCNLLSAFANNAITPAHYRALKAILNGGAVEWSAVIDAEIRWYIFICGVKRGVFGPADIEAESAKGSDSSR